MSILFFRYKNNFYFYGLKKISYYEEQHYRNYTGKDGIEKLPEQAYG